MSYALVIFVVWPVAFVAGFAFGWLVLGPLTVSRAGGSAGFDTAGENPGARGPVPPRRDNAAPLSRRG